jgi:hypothetical protein
MPVDGSPDEAALVGENGPLSSVQGLPRVLDRLDLSRPAFTLLHGAGNGILTIARGRYRSRSSDRRTTPTGSG